MSGRMDSTSPLVRFIHEHFFRLLIASYAVAALWPAFGLKVRDVSFGHSALFGEGMTITLPAVMLGFLLFNAGLGVRASELRLLAARPRTLVVGLAANLAVPIVFIFGLSRAMAIWHNPDEVQTILVGLALVASMPIAGSSTAWSQNADGDLALGLGLVVGSTLLSPVTTPLALHAVGFMARGEYARVLHALAAHGTGAFLAVCVIIPSLLGIATRLLIGEARHRAAKSWLKLASTVDLILLCYSNAAVALPRAIAQPDADFLIAILSITLGLCTLAFGSGWALARLLRADRPRRTALMYGLGMNNNGTGLVLASMALADHPGVMLPIIVYSLVQQVVAGAAGPLSRRHPGARSARPITLVETGVRSRRSRWRPARPALISGGPPARITIILMKKPTIVLPRAPDGRRSVRRSSATMDPSGNGASKPSKVEAVKIASQYLKTFVADEARNGASHFSEDAATVLKFHGSYQQDDRDVRAHLKREGKEKAFQFMVRVRMPGGKITAGQYRTVDQLANTVGNGTLRITTRQEFQLHGVVKEDLPTTLRRINESLLSTLAACGDVERNVLSCPAPIEDAIRDAMQADADRFASHFAPRASSYWDIWLDGEKVDNPLLPPAGPIKVPTPGDDPTEPIYGKAYLPRKFKTAFALPEDNCTDVHANDLGYLAIVEEGRLVGYNVLVGGGLGTTPSAQKTFPFLAVPLGYVDRDDLLAIGEAVIKVFRDFGNRSDRKRARLKYIIHDWGLPAFRAKVEEYLGRPLADPVPVEVSEVDDHLGWHRQGDGKLFLGIPVENGRIKDEGTLRMATGLRAIFAKYGTPARLTCQQSILLIDLDPSWRSDIELLLHEHGIATVEQVSTVRRWSMACPAMPTCGLAVTEAERRPADDPGPARGRAGAAGAG